MTLVCRSYPLKIVDEEVRQQLYVNLKKLGVQLKLATIHTRVESIDNQMVVHL